MFTLLLIVMAGFVANRCGIFDATLEKKLSNAIIYMTCPLLIIGSVMGEDLPDRRLIPPLFIVSVITYLLLCLICWFLPRLFVRQRGERGIYSFMLMFANVGFIGYPVVASIFDSRAVFYAALLNMPNTFFVFLVGLPFVAGKQAKINIWHILYHPAMIACYIAIAIVAFRITDIPAVVSNPIVLVGNITVPGALLIIGSSMANIKFKKLLGTPPVYVMTFFRLLAIPTAMYLLFKAIGINSFVNQINTILIAMPVASYGTMFCLQQNRDTTSMVQGTVITTILSVITIPLITMLF